MQKLTWPFPLVRDAGEEKATFFLYFRLRLGNQAGNGPF